MKKIIGFLKNNVFIVLLILLSIPSFALMIRPGIHSMQDFHLFRLYEFEKCVQRFEIPCRWAPDAGLGYGEPLFNFYAQLPYAVGEIFRLLGFSLMDSLKGLFILSLIGSGISMFYLSKKIWKNNYAALVSSLAYLYAPYRAVDVWVRGALPEALSFVLFPLIILSIEKKSFFGFGILTALLILTHNLSFLMFAPVILTWVIYRKFWKAIPAGIIAFLLSAFYVFPVIFETKFITLDATTKGYFDFRAHYLTLKQIFLSFNWGYGGSTWGDGDGLNLSVGIVQWMIPLIVFIPLTFKKKLAESKEFLIFFFLGLIFIFLTHNRSTIVWTALPFMKFIQFPWRFLGVAVFCLSLSSGFISNLWEKESVKRLILLLVVLVSVISGYLFFKPDIWIRETDDYFLSGLEWDRQREASIGDFWPNFGHEIPSAPNTGGYINYFPGWEGATPNNEGLIPIEGTVFKNTPVRSIGNMISLGTIVGIIIVWIKRRV